MRKTAGIMIVLLALSIFLAGCGAPGEEQTGQAYKKFQKKTIDKSVEQELTGKLECNGKDLVRNFYDGTGKLAKYEKVDSCVYGCAIDMKTREGSCMPKPTSSTPPAEESRQVNVCVSDTMYETAYIDVDLNTTTILNSTDCGRYGNFCLDDGSGAYCGRS